MEQSHLAVLSSSNPFIHVAYAFLPGNNWCLKIQEIIHYLQGRASGDIVRQLDSIPNVFALASCDLAELRGGDGGALLATHLSALREPDASASPPSAVILDLLIKPPTFLIGV